MRTIRVCVEDDVPAILAIINAGAEAYRGVIPADRWHEPYMEPAELRRELGAGVELWGLEVDGELAGVMGTQSVLDADLIRHAYVRPQLQRRGIGAALIDHLLRRSTKPLLVGTWATASWAIAFYQRHGFELVSTEDKVTLLETYWTIPDWQIEASVVLARDGAGAVAARRRPRPGHSQRRTRSV